MTDKIRIALSGSRSTMQTMTARGLPQDIFRARPFDLVQHCVTINSETEGMKPKRVKKERQVNEYAELLDDPFKDPYVAVLASFPNDLKAKLAAAFLFEKAIKSHLSNDKVKRTMGKQMPLWHTINGSFQDKLRDGTNIKPSMLILSTITKDSSAVKVEKLRDILEQYSNIPRVVVLAGTDPVSFSNSRLYMAINHCLYMAQGRRVEL